MGLAMAGDAAEMLMDVETFLTWEDGTDTRYELIDGRPVAMAPPSEAHSVIVANIAVAIRSRLPLGCRVGVEFGIRPPNRPKRNYYLADLSVICGGRVGEGNTPCLVVEVLSPSTEDHDRGRKLFDYQFIDTVQEVMLVWVEDRRVQHISRVADGWLQRDYIGDAAIPIACIDGDVTLSDIFRDI